MSLASAPVALHDRAEHSSRHEVSDRLLLGAPARSRTFREVPPHSCAVPCARSNDQTDLEVVKNEDAPARISIDRDGHDWDGFTL